MPKLKTGINPIDSTWVYFRSTTAKLMYFVNYKCASTLYRHWFAKIGWEVVHLSSDEVDWKNYYVFSYIRNPLIKHRKGVVEFFAKQQLTDLLESTMEVDDRWVNIISNIVDLDGHTRTIRSILGETTPLQIDWIPIDTSFDHKKYTIDLLEMHGEYILDQHKQQLYSAMRVNEATTTENKMFEKLMAVSVSDQIINFIDFDQCIYDMVINQDLIEKN